MVHELPQIHGTSLLLSRPARAEHLRELRLAAAQFAATAGAENPFDVALAVSEAVTNAIVHAYPEGTDGPVRLEASTDGAELLVVVADDGVGLRPRPDSPGLGLGLPTIAQVVSRLDIADGDGRGVRVQMRFPLARG